MKFNKWTVGLAAVGAVSLASVAQADDKPSTLASVSSTILSGYVDTSMQWNLGTGDTHAPAYKYGGAAKADGFNLDAVKITLEKPLDESEWAAGYKADILIGPDAAVLGTTPPFGNNFAIKQAYVALRAPLGNGLDFKVGVFDSVVGYESTEAVNNPNFTRSWGHTIEPSTHTGVLATYRVNNMIAFSGGIANTINPNIGGNPGTRTGSGPAVAGGNPNESSKTYMGSIALTAPDDWGFVAGSSLYAGFVEGFNVTFNRQQENLYAGATVATPVTGLRLGASFDYAKVNNPLNGVFGPGGNTTAQVHSFAAYASFQATEKLSVHGRLEYADVTPLAASAAQAGGVGIASSVLSATGTVQYDLWKNVLSRVEIRWDHALDGTDSFGGTGAAVFQNGHFVTGTLNNSFIIAANVIYKF
jgi:hypothetical protein